MKLSRKIVLKPNLLSYPIIEKLSSPDYEKYKDDIIMAVFLAKTHSIQDWQCTHYAKGVVSIAYPKAGISTRPEKIITIGLSPISARRLLSSNDEYNFSDWDKAAIGLMVSIALEQTFVNYDEYGIASLYV